MEQSPGVGKLHGLAFVLGILSTHAWLDHRKKTSLSLLFIVELNSLIESHPILITAFYFRGLNVHAYKMIKL